VIANQGRPQQDREIVKGFLHGVELTKVALESLRHFFRTVRQRTDYPHLHAVAWERFQKVLCGPSPPVSPVIRVIFFKPGCTWATSSVGSALIPCRLAIHRLKRPKGFLEPPVGKLLRVVHYRNLVGSGSVRTILDNRRQGSALRRSILNQGRKPNDSN
jgi:hypothetical protein